MACISVCIIGCGNKQDSEFPDGDGNEIVLTNKAREEETASQIPDIVFLNTVMYVKSTDEDVTQSAITFYDKNGNHYTCTDAYVCSLRFDQLVQEYTEGKLADKISYHTSCDVRELKENYYRLCKLSEVEVEIIYPEMGPDVLANDEAWYGLYYDQDGNLQSLLIHERNAHGDHYASDERANEIYEWYLGTFEK